MEKEVVFLAGLPRSGSTLLCNILNMHPDIGATPSSPLCSIIQNMRRLWSDDSFLLAQLDDNFDGVYNKLENSLRSFIETWSSDIDKRVVVDKSRGWLSCIETLRSLYPNVKLIVTVRDLRNVFSSIEKQHRKTLLLDFPDHMEHDIAADRVATLFAPNGIIGRPLRTLQNLQDIPNISPHVYIWKYEVFLKAPKAATNTLFNWLGVDNFDIDFNNIQQTTFESDSHYRMKYRHTIFNKIKTVQEDIQSMGYISPTLSEQIFTKHEWYYKKYYPEVISCFDNLNKIDEPIVGVSEIPEEIITS